MGNPGHYDYKKLKVGDRCVCKYMEGIEDWARREDYEGRMGVVCSVGDTIFVTWDNPEGRIGMPSAWRLAPLDPPLSLDKVRATRGGWGVRNLRTTGDPQRPYIAEVQVCGAWMDLTFLDNGMFYAHFEQPIDLVEAK